MKGTSTGDTAMRLDFNHLLHESDLDFAAVLFVFVAFVILTLIVILPI